MSEVDTAFLRRWLDMIAVVGGWEYQKLSEAFDEIDRLRQRVAELESLLRIERDEEDQRRMDKPF